MAKTRLRRRSGQAIRGTDWISRARAEARIGGSLRFEPPTVVSRTAKRRCRKAPFTCGRIVHSETAPAGSGCGRPGGAGRPHPLVRKDTPGHFQWAYRCDHLERPSRECGAPPWVGDYQATEFSMTAPRIPAGRSWASRVSVSLRAGERADVKLDEVARERPLTEEWADHGLWRRLRRSGSQVRVPTSQSQASLYCAKIIICKRRSGRL
jgi:hypothetical protein